MINQIRPVCVVLSMIWLAGCKSLTQPLLSPEVSLAGVRLQHADLATQTFILDFAVRNPNAIAIPIRSINYGVTLAGASLAKGSSEERFSVPANGAGEFSINVSTSLIETVRMLGTRVLRGGEQELEYSVGGSVDVDIPFVRPLPFSSTGVVRLNISD